MINRHDPWIANLLGKLRRLTSAITRKRLVITAMVITAILMMGAGIAKGLQDGWPLLLSGLGFLLGMILLHWPKKWRIRLPMPDMHPDQHTIYYSRRDIRKFQAIADQTTLDDYMAVMSEGHQTFEGIVHELAKGGYFVCHTTDRGHFIVNWHFDIIEPETKQKYPDIPYLRLVPDDEETDDDDA